MMLVKVMEREGKLGELEVRAETLQQGSEQFQVMMIVGPMVYNHRKPLLPMVVLPQNHRKTIDPNGCPQPFHSMVIVTLKTIESLRW